MLSRLIIHPFLIGVAPILFLWSQNRAEMSFSQVYQPAALVLVAVAVILLIGRRAGGKLSKLGLCVSLVLLLFLSFGHLTQILIEVGLNGFEPEIAGALSLLICVVVAVAVVKSRRSLRGATAGLNIASIAFVVLQLIQAADASASQSSLDKPLLPLTPATATGEETPDIFYILVDGYGRQDVLHDLYDLDNAEFIGYLRENGFYVADSSHANYGQTLLSLSSALYCDYLQDLWELYRYDRDRSGLLAQLPDNPVQAQLKANGYEFWSFATGSEITEFPEADHYREPRGSLSEFENLLVSLTPLPYLLSDSVSQYGAHRRRINFVFDSLGRLEPTDRPKFVFAHILAPHPPFVFGADGKAIDPDRPFALHDGNGFEAIGGTQAEYVAGYRAQAAYITARLQEMVRGLLDNYSATPPVIMLQSDHGPGSRTQWNLAALTDIRERFGILNAYLLPEGADSLLHPSISPVNSFRVLLNSCFGADLELLPDSAYYSPFQYPYDFENVTERL